MLFHNCRTLDMSTPLQDLPQHDYLTKTCLSSESNFQWHFRLCDLPYLVHDLHSKPHQTVGQLLTFILSFIPPMKLDVSIFIVWYHFWEITCILVCCTEFKHKIGSKFRCWRAFNPPDWKLGYDYRTPESK